MHYICRFIVADQSHCVPGHGRDRVGLGGGRGRDVGGHRDGGRGGPRCKFIDLLLLSSFSEAMSLAGVVVELRELRNFRGVGVLRGGGGGGGGGGRGDG